MSGTMSEIARLDEKINLFMTSQSEFNKNINDNLKELSKTQALSQVQQVEINNIVINFNRMSGKIDKLNDDVAKLNTSNALMIDFKGQVRHLKWVSVGLFGAVIVALIKTILFP
jgi:peptidoglycan hydrolase CwlO-like protein